MPTMVLGKLYYICKKCNYMFPFDEVERRSPDGLLEHERDCCPRCSHTWFEKKWVEFDPPQAEFFQCSECGDLFDDPIQRTHHQIEKHDGRVSDLSNLK